MQATFLGTGTSHGIPVVGCRCSVCTSTNDKNKRTRASLWVVKTQNGVPRSLVIDTATEFRLQALKVGLRQLDGILLTHSHADHLHGLDDVRPLCRTDKPIPVFGTDETLQEITQRFDYIFHPRQRGGGVPNLTLHQIQPGTPFTFEGFDILPLPVKHGNLDIVGYRIGTLAYITDCSYIPPSTLDLVQGLDILILGALRKRPHPTHFSILEALRIIEAANPKKAFLTHLCHEIDHEDIKKELPLGVAPSFDGFELDLGDPDREIIL